MITNYAHPILVWTCPRKYLFPLCSIYIPASTVFPSEYIRSPLPRGFHHKEVQRKRETNNRSCDRQANTEDARCSVVEWHINVAVLVVWEGINTHGIELRHEGQGKEDDGDNVQDKQSDRIATAVLGDFARVVCFEDVGLSLCTLLVRKDNRSVWTGHSTDVSSRTSYSAIYTLSRHFRPFVRL